MKSLNVFRHLVNFVVKLGRQHIIILCGCALGSFAGFWGILAGFLTSFFIETLIIRVRKDKTLGIALENPFASSLAKELMTDGSMHIIKDEPFDGALLVCALVIYCTGNPEFGDNK